MTPNSLRASGSPAATIARKIFSTVFFGLFALIGIVVFGIMLASLSRTVRSYFWEKTPCTIVESRHLEPGPETARTDGFRIRYRYRAADGLHTSDQLTVGIKESLDARAIEKLLARYPAGAEATCYVAPGDSSQAVLRRGSLWLALVLLFPLVFLGVGAFGILRVWRPGALSSLFASRGGSSAALTKSAPAIFFGLFAVVGGALLYFVAIRPLRLWHAARTWPAVPCEIVSSSVGSHTSTDSKRHTSTTYSIDITYRYKVAGREYRSDRYEVMGGSSSGRSRKEQVVARYPAGSKTSCYVDPADPTEALLDRGLSLFMLIGLIPAIFLVVGVGGLAALARSALKSRGSAALPGVPSLPAEPSVPTIPSGSPPGAIALKAGLSPAGKFVGSLLAAIVWNGITSVFVVTAVKSWIQHHPEVFLTIFITPFVLIGVGLVGLVGATFLNLFNPRVALTVNSQSVQLGGTLDARWSISGAASRIRTLRIVLEGREEITERHNGKTSTHRSTLAQLPIVETSDPFRIREGRAQFEIPAGLKPTSESVGTSVIWELQVRGEIPRYPDVSEDFPITILASVR